MVPETPVAASSAAVSSAALGFSTFAAAGRPRSKHHLPVPVLLRKLWCITCTVTSVILRPFRCVHMKGYALLAWL